MGKTGRAEGTALQRPWGEECAPFHASGLTVGLPGLPKPSEPSRGQEPRQGWQSPPPNSVPNWSPRAPAAAHGCLPPQAGEATGPSLLRTALPGPLDMALLWPINVSRSDKVHFLEQVFMSRGTTAVLLPLCQATGSVPDGPALSV